MSEMTIGIIGFGRIGAEHAKWMEKAAGARVALVADTTPARRELAKSRGLPTCESVEALIGDPSIDAVLVSLPTSMHFDCAAAALSAGKHVMIEKPMALDLPQSRTLVEQARAANRTLSVFQNRRWDLDFLTVKDAVASGVLGRILNVESRLGQWASCVGPAAREWHPNWRNEAIFGGGGLYDWGSHFVDQIWRLMLSASSAKPTHVYAQLRGNIWTDDCDDFARVCIDFDNGAVGLVEINTTTTRPLPRWHIDGTEGSADSPYSLDFNLRTWAKLDFTPAREATTSQPFPIAPDDEVLNETQIWEQFIRACRGEGRCAVSAESVLPTMALLDAARQSSKEGHEIDVTDVVEWKL